MPTTTVTKLTWKVTRMSNYKAIFLKWGRLSGNGKWPEVVEQVSLGSNWKILISMNCGFDGIVPTAGERALWNCWIDFVTKTRMPPLYGDIITCRSMHSIHLTNCNYISKNFVEISRFCSLSMVGYLTFIIYYIN